MPIDHQYMTYEFILRVAGIDRINRVIETVSEKIVIVHGISWTRENVEQLSSIAHAPGDGNPRPPTNSRGQLFEEFFKLQRSPTMSLARLVSRVTEPACAKPRSGVFFAILLVVTIVLGCTSENLTERSLPLGEGSAGERRESSQTSTIPVKLQPGPVSPASAERGELTADSPPEAVCRRFFMQLNRQHEDDFEMLLTPAALNFVTQLKFRIPPVADSGVQVRVTPPKYNSIREDVCYVECHWKDGREAGHFESSLTLMLRRLKAGWRVAGMVVAAEADGELELLSFESLTDLRQIQTTVEKVVPAESG
jgi:hypothetical protein